MDPEETLVLLKSKSTAKAGRTLDVIYEVCQNLVSRGVFDFSFSTVAMAGSSKGVPKAQSIRNASGESYRLLIKSFESCYQKRGKSNSHRAKDAWIENIKDPTLKMLVRIQQSELEEARRMIREIVPPNSEIYIDDQTSARGKFRLTELERRAIEYLLSKDFLDVTDFVSGDFGDVIDKNGVKIFRPGTSGALKKALDNL